MPEAGALSALIDHDVVNVQMIAAHESVDWAHPKHADHCAARESADEFVAAMALPLNASKEFPLAQVGTQLNDQGEGHGPFLGVEATDRQFCNVAHSALLQFCLNTS